MLQTPAIENGRWAIYDVKSGTTLGYIKIEKGKFYVKAEGENYLPLPSFQQCREYFINRGYTIGGNRID